MPGLADVRVTARMSKRWVNSETRPRLSRHRQVPEVAGGAGCSRRDPPGGGSLHSCRPEGARREGGKVAGKAVPTTKLQPRACALASPEIGSSPLERSLDSSASTEGRSASGRGPRSSPSFELSVVTRDSGRARFNSSLKRSVCAVGGGRGGDAGDGRFAPRTTFLTPTTSATEACSACTREERSSHPRGGGEAMSKCRPKAEAGLLDLFDHGVGFEVTADSILIRIPYTALLEDAVVQRAFQGLVKISTSEEESGMSPSQEDPGIGPSES